MYRFYSLCREYNRGMTQEMKERQASAVLLAALCIPQMPMNQGAADGSKEHGISTTLEDDMVKQKMGRMATLLGFHTRNPTREALLQEIKSKNILDEVPDHFRDLYDVLENNSDPLIMVEKTRPFLDQLKAHGRIPQAPQSPPESLQQPIFAPRPFDIGRRREAHQRA